MQEVQLLDKKFRIYIPSERVDEAVRSVAAKLNDDFRGCTDVPVLLCVLNGAMMFCSDLMKHLEFNPELVCVKLTSYCGTVSTGEVKQTTGFTGSVAGRRVIVCEDIVDAGNTIVALKKLLLEQGAADVKICTMLLKPEMYHKDERIDYVAMEIKNDFIVGHGLDYNEIGRNLKDIYVLSE